MMGQLEYFPAFFGYLDSLKLLEDAQVGRVFRAALMYAKDGTMPDLDAVEMMAFSFIRGDIDRAKIKYEEKCERLRANGMKGGRPPSENQKEPEGTKRFTENQKEPEEPKQDNTKQDNTIQGESTRARTRGSGKQSGKRLTVGGPDAAGGATHRDEPVPPTVDDINAYCREAGLMHVDPRRFFDNYAAAGWMRNGEPIRDWKALCRKWDAEDAEKAAHAAPKKPQETSFDTDEFFEAALARSYADYNREGGWTGDES